MPYRTPSRRVPHTWGHRSPSLGALPYAVQLQEGGSTVGKLVLDTVTALTVFLGGLGAADALILALTR